MFGDFAMFATFWRIKLAELGGELLLLDIQIHGTFLGKKAQYKTHVSLQLQGITRSKCTHEQKN